MANSNGNGTWPNVTELLYYRQLCPRSVLHEIQTNGDDAGSNTSSTKSNGSIAKKPVSVINPLASRLQISHSRAHSSPASLQQTYAGLNAQPPANPIIASIGAQVPLILYSFWCCCAVSLIGLIKSFGGYGCSVHNDQCSSTYGVTFSQMNLFVDSNYNWRALLYFVSVFPIC